MDQKFHTFRAPTLDEAYREMRKQLGDDAVVVRTGPVRESGILGFLRRGRVEVIASAPVPKGRPLSPAERKYGTASAPAEAPSSGENTVAYFEQLVRDAQKRMAGAQPPPPTPASTGAGGSQGRAAVAPVLPFKRPQEEDRDDIRREVAQMREMLQVLMAETPGAGIPPELVPHYRMLLDRGVSRNLAAGLMAYATRGSDLDLLRDPRVFLERLKLEIRKRVNVSGGIALTGGTCRVAAFVGATGVGKTTNLAKLAAYYTVRERARVGLITADTYRVGAPEQLRIYANIIGVPLTVVNDPKEMAVAVRQHRDCDLVLVDTAGGSQFNMKQILELKEMLGAAQPDEVLLVLGANTQLEELRNVVTSFKAVNPGSLFFTKLDETRRFGGLMSLAVEAALPLS
ncbi:MAG: flagellar biosynthesis protein FlhF, partial [FCB group bacterium]|nr:flagellar biosynthesis protein FlhF [FCB group bacterium]